jgi:hypothetical protein
MGAARGIHNLRSVRTFASVALALPSLLRHAERYQYRAYRRTLEGT